MHSPQEALSGMHVKGGLIRARFLFMVLRHGADAWSAVLARLPDDDRRVFADLGIESYYPLALLDRVDTAIADALGGNREAVFTQLGEFSATSSLSGPFSSLLNPDIHAFLTQTAVIHRSYQDFGDAAYTALGDKSGLLKITYEAAPPASFTISGTAYFRKAIELCGAQNVHIRRTDYRADDKVTFEFYAAWQ